MTVWRPIFLLTENEYSRTQNSKTEGLYKDVFFWRLVFISIAECFENSLIQKWWSQIWKEENLNEKRTNKMWYIHVYIHIVEYCSAVKKRMKNLPFAATWMDLKVIILKKISQTKKSKCCMISLTCGIWKIQKTSDYNKNQTHRYREQTSGFQLGRRLGKIRDRGVRGIHY